AKADALPYRPEPQSKEEVSLPTVPSAETAETAELSAETKRQKEKARPPYQAPTPPANRPAPQRRSFASVMKRRISQRRRA
ncbi:MAG: hypothetical protein K2F79_09670, partial [Muribaculaceae bacterium]|nr:hypothetical protein [Muribaculaceae bacterium]